MKRCSKCGEVKALSEFHRNKRTKDGLQYRCKPCHVAGVAEAIRKNPKRHLAQTNKYRANHRGRVQETARLRYERSPERVIARDNRLTKEELTALKPIRQGERLRQWKLRHPEEAKELARRITMRYYARKKSAPGYASTEAIHQRWLYYCGKCWMCGAEATQTDHVIALNRGGSEWPANQRPACARCNQSKSDRDHREFLAAAV